MPQHIDFERFKNAYAASAIFTALLSVAAFFLLVLIITTPFARPERIAYLLVITGADISHMVVLWLLSRAHSGSSARR